MQDSINQNLETRPQAKKIGMKHYNFNQKKKKKKKKNGARKIKLASQCQTKHIHDNRQSKLKI